MVIPSDRLLPANTHVYKNVSYRKQIARQHSWSIFLTTSLITMQNLVAVSHTVCTDVGGPNFFRTLGPSPFGLDMADLLETGSYATCATIPNFVAVGQTVWA